MNIKIEVIEWQDDYVICKIPIEIVED